MASGIDYAQTYQAAERAYMQGSYEEAADIIEQLAESYPSDPEHEAYRNEWNTRPGRRLLPTLAPGLERP